MDAWTEHEVCCEGEQFFFFLAMFRENPDGNKTQTDIWTGKSVRRLFILFSVFHSLYLWV